MSGTTTLDMLSARQVNSAEYTGLQATLPGISGAGQFIIAMNSLTSQLAASVNAGPFVPFFGFSGPIVTMQQAYDGGDPVGTGTGRSITNMTGGAFVVTNDRDAATNVFTITKAPATLPFAGNALDVTMGTFALGTGLAISHVAPQAVTGITVAMSPSGAALARGIAVTMNAASRSYGVIITHSGSVAGAAGTPSIALRITGSIQSTGFEMSNGSALPRSAANEGRIMYDVGTQTFMMSLNGAAYSSIGVAAGASLQLAYAGGAPIVVTGANPVTIANAAGVTSNLLGLTDLTTAANANYGITYTRAPLPGGAFTGGAINIQNTPQNAAQNETGVLILVNHTSGALSTDTTLGFGITMTPGAAAAVRGQTITMGAFTSAAGWSAKHIWNGTAGTAVGNGIVNVELGGQTVAGVLTGVECDLSNVNAATAVDLTCYNARLPVDIGTNNSVGLSVTRTGTWTTNGAQWQGSLISVTNTPTEGIGGVNTTERGTLVNIVHIGTAGLGIIADNTTGLNINMQAAVASANMIGAEITMGTLATGPALHITHNNAASGNGIVIAISSADASSALSCNLTQTTFTGGGMRGVVVSKVCTVTTTQTATNELLYLINNMSQGGAGQTLTLNGSIARIVHISTQAGGTTVTDTTRGLTIDMQPGVSSVVTGMSIIMNATAIGDAFVITHGGVGGNSDQIRFASVVDGTGAHLRGPAAGDFVIKSGINAVIPSSGRSIVMTASNANTTGAGGSVRLNAGAAAGVDQNGGDISLTPTVATGAGIRGLVDIADSAAAMGGGAAPTVGTIGGTGPAAAAQNTWLAVKMGGVLSYIPIWR